ncbi:DUF3549 family protein [Phytohalomonas tamaricis]|uniref:DUF3549 family protein n=1 Tax=Phytohalomonas tamaricis TaxID=2081032 RepID=UPI000D0B77FB|nr:DUF3549 family protein [Phytohalomonas tamaricis]
MQAINTLYEFFQRAAITPRLYHMGRRVVPCSLEHLHEFEQGHIAWESPWRLEARLAIIFSPRADSDDPAVWFLALPLDEQGFLSPALRDAFLQRLLETLGRSALAPTIADTAQVDNLMQDNPLAFTPEPTFRAMFTARASHDMNRPASTHWELADSYFTGQQQLDHWPALSWQGIADFVVRRQAQHDVDIALRLPELPAEALVALCYCLEHVPPMIDGLIDALRQRGEQARAEHDTKVFYACLRAAISSANARASDWMDDLLMQATHADSELLAACAARGWHHLEHGERLPRFLDLAAQGSDTQFSALARDLAMVPRLRIPVLMTLRQAAPDSTIGRRLKALTRS